MNKKLYIPGLLILTLNGCSSEDMATNEQPVATEAEVTPEVSQPTTPEAANPFFSESSLFMKYPPFDQIEDDHYMPAFEAGMAEELAEIEAIANQAAAPTFENTFLPMELSGKTLERVASVFYGLISAHTNDTLDEVQVEVAPLLSEHNDEILLNAELFERIKTIYDNRASLGLDAESLRLVEETHRDFVRAGAELSDEDKERLRAINTELAELSTSFSQNVLDEVNDVAIIVDTVEELAGLTEAEIQSAADAAEARDLPGKYVIPMLNTTQQPTMASLENRALRQRMIETSMVRGSRGGGYDNREIVSRTAQLRAERAQLLGYQTHADYILDDQTAKTVDAVNERLASLTPPAVANAQREAADLQAMIDAEGGDFELAAWDWDYYSEKVRQQRYAFDGAELKPYLELDSVLIDGVFWAATQIYGITFEERFDLPVYQEDVRVFEVFEEDGSTLSLFIFDPYARESKRGGAWMRAYISQSQLEDQLSIVANHLNITKPPEGEPTLLTFDEVTTAFHEFGHALHGMFSDVTYPSFAGTRVPRDFVEYPSQVNEMWSTWPAVLANYAKHYETGEAMPQELLDRVLAAEQFNQGYATTEYLAASLTDQALHQLGPDAIPSADELMQFEANALAAAGADLATVPPRYRLTYFSHIMGGYSAGYYSYIWSEVLDADTVEWFKENGGMTRENGQHFRDTLLSRGGSAEAMSLFRDFAGREPNVEPLLIRRGLN
jgi:peptidyl-dipeptidase Dcp